MESLQPVKNTIKYTKFRHFLTLEKILDNS